MKAIKRIIIVFAIIAVILEAVCLGIKVGVSKEADKVKTTHTSYAAEVSEADGSYIYKVSDKSYSEAEYIDYMEKGIKSMDALLVVQGILAGFFILTAAAAGKSAKKREQLAQA